MKYFAIYNDGVYKETISLQSLLDNYKLFYKFYMNKQFGKDKLSWGEEMNLPQYDDFYEIDTDLELHQVREVVEHTFYVDTLELLKVIGTLNKIK